VHKHLRKNNVVKVRTARGLETKITENHSLFTFDKSGHLIPCEPKLEQFVALEGSIKDQSKTIIKIDIIKEFINNLPEKELNYLKCDLIQKNVKLPENIRKWLKDNARKHYSTKKYFSELKNVYKTKLPLKKYFDIKVSTKKSCRYPFPRDISINKELGAFLGYYTSEGNCSTLKGKYSVTLVQKNKQIKDKMISCLNKLSIKFSMYKNNININSYIFTLLCKYVFMCGDKALNKEVPSIIFNSSDDVKWAFLQAYLEGDGGYRFNKNRCIDYVHCGSISRKLAVGLFFLCRQLNIKKIAVLFDKKENTRGAKYDIYGLRIYESLPFVSIKNKGSSSYYNTKLKALDSSKAFKKYGNKYSLACRTQSDTSDVVMFDFIKSIKKLDKQSKYVYDLSVKDVEKFVGGLGLLIHHNSIFGEGIDIPSLDALIIAKAQKSKVDSLQLVGRVLRLNEETNKKEGIVIDIQDKNIRYLKNHSKDRVKIYSEEELFEMIPINAADEIRF